MKFMQVKSNLAILFEKYKKHFYELGNIVTGINEKLGKGMLPCREESETINNRISTLYDELKEIDNEVFKVSNEHVPCDTDIECLEKIINNISENIRKVQEYKDYINKIYCEFNSIYVQDDIKNYDKFNAELTGNKNALKNIIEGFEDEDINELEKIAANLKRFSIFYDAVKNPEITEEKEFIDEFKNDIMLVIGISKQYYKSDYYEGELYNKTINADDDIAETEDNQGDILTNTELKKDMDNDKADSDIEVSDTKEETNAENNDPETERKNDVLRDEVKVIFERYNSDSINPNNLTDLSKKIKLNKLTESLKKCIFEISNDKKLLFFAADMKIFTTQQFNIFKSFYGIDGQSSDILDKMVSKGWFTKLNAGGIYAYGCSDKIVSAFAIVSRELKFIKLNMLGLNNYNVQNKKSLIEYYLKLNNYAANYYNSYLKEKDIDDISNENGCFCFSKSDTKSENEYFNIYVSILNEYSKEKIENILSEIKITDNRKELLVLYETNEAELTNVLKNIENINQYISIKLADENGGFTDLDVNCSKAEIEVAATVETMAEEMAYELNVSEDEKHEAQETISEKISNFEEEIKYTETKEPEIKDTENIKEDNAESTVSADESNDKSREEITEPEPHVYNESKKNQTKDTEEFFDTGGRSIEELKNNIFEMIISGKIYAAVTYSNAASKKDKYIGDIYKYLSYACGAPDNDYSIDSNTVFSVFDLDDSQDVFKNYCLITASLRSAFSECVDFNCHTLNIKEYIEGKIKGISNVLKLIYSLITFKKEVHKGVDAYADYRMKQETDIKNELKNIEREIKELNEKYICANRNEDIKQKRYKETKLKLFKKNSELCETINIILNDSDLDYSDKSELVKEFVCKNYIKDNEICSPENIDTVKIENLIDDAWDEAGGNVRAVMKTSKLMGSLRNNVFSGVKRFASALSEWVVYADMLGNKKEDAGQEKYIKIKKQLLIDTEQALTELNSVFEGVSEEEKAGINCLVYSLREILNKLKGSYYTDEYKYFYIDFLRTWHVPLNYEYYPDYDLKFYDVEGFSIFDRIESHINETDENGITDSLENRLSEIINFTKDEDMDFGSAKLIYDYLKIRGIKYEMKYDIDSCAESSKGILDDKLKNFTGMLDMAQQYGQFEIVSKNNVVSSKNKIASVVAYFYDDAVITGNYGFIIRLMQKYTEKIKNDSGQRKEGLTRQLENVLRALPDKNNENVLKMKEAIEKNIEDFNYTVAEDRIGRLKKGEFSIIDDDLIIEDDYLMEFQEKFKFNSILANNKEFRNIIKSDRKNKEVRGGEKLINNWIVKNKNLQTRVTALLDTLNFKVREINKITPSDYDIFDVKIMESKSVSDRKHPIAAWGTEAENNGIRVVCLFGNYDCNGLLGVFQTIGVTKNTIVFLDWTIDLPNRNKLARKIKQKFFENSIIIIDKAVIVFLAQHYNAVNIDKILMMVTMPYSYYQPYVLKSKNMTDEIFIGRKNELAKIKDIKGPNLIYGGRQLGKSAMLRKAAKEINSLPEGERQKAVIVEIKDLNCQESLAKIEEELKKYDIINEDAVCDTWENLSKELNKVISGDDNTRKYNYLLLMLDEGDAFIADSGNYNYKQLGDLKRVNEIVNERFKFVIAGLRDVAKFSSRAISENSDIIQHESLIVKPFGFTEARQLVEAPLSYLGFRFDENARENIIPLILASTNYFPGLVQLYCFKLVETLKNDNYAGYNETNSPPYELGELHIKEILSDENFTDQIKQMFEITLRLDEDNYYYMIALCFAYRYYNDYNASGKGYSVDEIYEIIDGYGIKKLKSFEDGEKLSETKKKLGVLFKELCDMNILREVLSNRYVFARDNYAQLLGNPDEIENALLEYMED